MIEKTACFTGHRKIPSEQYDYIARRLEEVIIKYIDLGYCYFGTGGAVGFDTLAAQIILKLKNQFPHIRLILVLPCRDQTSGWKKKDIEEYERIKILADKVVYISNEYYDGCMQKRNRHMIDNSSLCIAYQTSTIGGTAYTTMYAEKNGVLLINIADKCH